MRRALNPRDFFELTLAMTFLCLTQLAYSLVEELAVSLLTRIFVGKIVASFMPLVFNPGQINY